MSITVDGGTACRRQIVERRQANLRSLLHAFYRTRRRTVRRTHATAQPINYYMDSYSTRAWAMVLLIVLLCVTDAYFTVILVNSGATELNPIVLYLLEGGTTAFFAVKYLVTAICAVLILIHKRFMIFGLRGYHVLSICVLGYLLLFNYQLTLLSQLF